MLVLVGLGTMQVEPEMQRTLHMLLWSKRICPSELVVTPHGPVLVGEQVVIGVPAVMAPAILKSSGDPARLAQMLAL